MSSSSVQTAYEWRVEMPCESGFDVLVAGGGPAGCAAAISAARLGAKVLLVEATGCLGGMGSSGLVSALDPVGDGQRCLVGGVALEIFETLYERGEMGPQVTPDYWRRRYMTWTPFHPEGLKVLLDELTAQAGVEVRFFTTLIAADFDGHAVRGIVTHNIEGLRHIQARSFIDCTGDAVLANLCGVECRTNPEFMPGTLCSLHAGIDWERARHARQQEIIHKAVDDGHFTQPDRHLPGMTQIGKTLGYLNGGHLFGKDPLSCHGLSNGMVLGRKLAREYVEFYRKYVDGCQDIELVATAALIGVRESRRIVGECELKFDDFLSRRQFPDQIGVFNKFVDIHVRDCSDKEYERFKKEAQEIGRIPPGECFGLPYGILVPKGALNLWVAGRCNSSDIQVHGSIRVMPAAYVMGQAAGTAAVQALEYGQTAYGLDTDALRQTLQNNGAVLT